MNSPANSFGAITRLMTWSICISALSACMTLTGNNPGLRTPGEFIDDEFIESIARREIRAEDEALRTAHVVVVSYNGIVLLAGQVETSALRQKAQVRVANLREVRRVHNEITVEEPIPLAIRSNDTWLTTKVKSKLLASNQVSANRIKVVTENSVVYLMGMVTRTEAERAVEITQTTSGIRKIVKIFDYLTI